MKKIFLFCLIYCGSTVAKCQTKYFQQKVDYKIDVKLNDIDNSLDGFETIDYTNNSPDTLQFIWFHFWPNAYKNDRTAFSEQLLKLGRTDFYFSDENKRGYINRLDFKVDGTTANLGNHLQYIDVAKLILPSPLLPGKRIKITTPFHVKIPFNFSRGGYVENTYQITQWYPKPAVYDNKGWHPMPYLDQGEFYSEFGNFNVQITVPKDYVIAATGQLQDKNEINWLKEKAMSVSRNEIQKKSEIHKKNNRENNQKQKTILKNQNQGSKQNSDVSKLQTEEHKTLIYIQNNIHDFAWFADKNFLIRYDTLKLPSGKIIDAYSFFTPSGLPIWKNSIQFLKDAIRTRSKWLGEYPYNVVTAVEAKMGFSGGMEYPTITSISPTQDEKSLDMTIEHEVGHNWNYGILGSNERQHPWLDEGVNTYFDNRYEKIKYPAEFQKKEHDFLNKRIPADNADIVLRTQIISKKDQPIETSSEDFSETNYGVIAYYKTGLWMKRLEDFIGKDLFDSCLHEYYNQWKFKHPSPEDFKKVIEEVSNKNVDSIFSFLSKKGNLKPARNKKFKLYPFFSFNNTDKYNYLFVSPAVGFNYYDKQMVGALFHNYTYPEPAFHFFAAPMYATGTKTFTGIARAGYNFMSYGSIRKTEISISGEKFTMDQFTDSSGAKNYLGFSKIVPSIKLVFRNKNATSIVKKWLQWKTYLIEETGYLFSRDTVQQIDVINYPKTSRYLNQLTFALENSRVLYPYSANLIAEQAKEFLRLSFEGKYFFNYATGGGVEARLFAGKFIYLGEKTEASRYQLTMTGANGYEDYTYSNYFVGRNEFQKFPSQQIMIRDGGFKVRSDLNFYKIGKSDDWLTALNLKTDFPKILNPLQVLPIKIPIKIFFDIGSFAEAWQRDATTGKFIYDAGFQLSLFKNVLNIYVPIFYSKVYSDYFKSTITENRFWRNISFSIDIQNLRLNKILDFGDL